MVVPLVYRDRLMGVLALKEKLSGERLTGKTRRSLSTLANQAALAIETALLHDEMTRQAELKRDLEIARDIQTSLLPRTLPVVEGFSFFGGSLPAKVVEGYFDPLHSVWRSRRRRRERPAARSRDRRRLRQVRPGFASYGRRERDRLFPCADHS